MNVFVRNFKITMAYKKNQKTETMRQRSLDQNHVTTPSVQFLKLGPMFKPHKQKLILIKGQLKKEDFMKMDLVNMYLWCANSSGNCVTFMRFYLSDTYQAHTKLSSLSSLRIT